eukprot:SAG31_NODE_42041_length_273_cov_0.873563_1_plen_44_part_00
MSLVPWSFLLTPRTLFLLLHLAFVLALVVVIRVLLLVSHWCCH